MINIRQPIMEHVSRIISAVTHDEQVHEKYGEAVFKSFQTAAAEKDFGYYRLPDIAKLKSLIDAAPNEPRHPVFMAHIRACEHIILDAVAILASEAILDTQAIYGDNDEAEPLLHKLRTVLRLCGETAPDFNEIQEWIDKYAAAAAKPQSGTFGTMSDCSAKLYRNRPIYMAKLLCALTGENPEEPLHTVRNRATGDLYRSVQAAVNAFKCPGPCNPDCPLNPSVHISLQTYVHMCHPDYVKDHQADVMELINCEPV